MSDNSVDVLLLTRDLELIEAIEQCRPVDFRLLHSPDASGPPVLARQVWIDLDSGLPTEATIGSERRVYFHRDPPPNTDDFPPGLFVRKPSSRTVLRVLWANVAETSVATTNYRFPETVPGWLLDLHDLDLRSLCQKCVSTVSNRFGFQRAALYLCDESRRTLTLAESNCDFAIDLMIRLTPDSDHVFARACDFELFRATAGLGVACATHSWHAPALPAPIGESPALLLPLRADGGLVGVLCLLDGPIDAAAAIPLRAVSAFLARSLQNARQFERVRTEARVDGLTGLFNYRWLCESLEKEIPRAQRYSAPLSVLVVDLDEFKPLNDAYGHIAGDAILRHVAARIMAVLRQTDSAARIGGDEFVVLLPATDAAGAAHAAERVLASVRDHEPLIQEKHVPIRVSVGTATWQAGWDALRLLQEADNSMYCAKRGGRNRLHCPTAGTTTLPLETLAPDSASQAIG